MKQWWLENLNGWREPDPFDIDHAAASTPDWVWDLIAKIRVHADAISGDDQRRLLAIADGLEKAGLAGTFAEWEAKHGARAWEALAQLKVEFVPPKPDEVLSGHRLAHEVEQVFPDAKTETQVRQEIEAKRAALGKVTRLAPGGF